MKDEKETPRCQYCPFLLTRLRSVDNCATWLCLAGDCAIYDKVVGQCAILELGIGARQAPMATVMGGLANARQAGRRDLEQEIILGDEDEKDVDEGL